MSQQLGNEVERQGKANKSTTPRTALSFQRKEEELSWVHMYSVHNILYLLIVVPFVEYTVSERSCPTATNLNDRQRHCVEFAQSSKASGHLIDRGSP